MRTALVVAALAVAAILVAFLAGMGDDGRGAKRAGELLEQRSKRQTPAETTGADTPPSTERTSGKASASRQRKLVYQDGAPESETAEGT